MFDSRTSAGTLLAAHLQKRKVKADIVLGLPRGGVVVAAEIAHTLKLPLDVVVVKKLGAPHNPELAIGAITQDGVTYIDQQLAQSVEANTNYLSNEIERKLKELQAREQLLRVGRLPLQVKNKRVILVDDGVATGATILAAIQWLKQKQVSHVLLALPVAPKDSVKKLEQLVDQCVILEKPPDFGAVGQFYKDFREVNEEEVTKILNPKP